MTAVGASRTVNDSVLSNLLFRDEGGIRPFQLEPNEITREPRGKRVTVVRLAIRYCGLDLPYTSRHLG
jgi:hypothetical protein